MSPVHDQSYRRYQGTRLPPGRAWSVILRHGLRSFLSRKVFLGLLLVAWVPFLVRSSSDLSGRDLSTDAADPGRDARDVPRTSSTLRASSRFSSRSTWARASSPTIAVRTRCRSISRNPCCGSSTSPASSASSSVYLALVTLLPAVLLLVMQVGAFGQLRPASRQSGSGAGRGPGVRSCASSCRRWRCWRCRRCRRAARYVAIMYTGVLFFSEALYAVLAFVTGRPAWPGCRSRETST